MKQIHSIQLLILRNMLFAKESRYTDLKPKTVMENNQFDFHLDQLIKSGYVKKLEKKYVLTSFGKEYANRMDTDTVLVTTQSKVSVILCPIKSGNNYLIYTRLKQPFYGCQGFMSGKVQYGELVINAAKRELKEETGLTGSPKIFCIRHFLVLDKKTKELVEDKIMFYCLVENLKGKIRPHNEGKYEWVKEKDLPKYVTNHFENYKAFQRDLDEIKNFEGNIRFSEIVHKSVKF